MWYLLIYVSGILCGIVGTVLYAALVCNETEDDEYSDEFYEEALKQAKKSLKEPRDQHSPELPYNDYMK